MVGVDLTNMFVKAMCVEIICCGFRPLRTIFDASVVSFWLFFVVLTMVIPFFQNLIFSDSRHGPVPKENVKSAKARKSTKTPSQTHRKSSVALNFVTFRPIFVDHVFLLR